MSLTEREKTAEKALRRLTPSLMKGLSPDIRHELYGRDMLTWNEKERIGENLLAQQSWLYSFLSSHQNHRNTDIAIVSASDVSARTEQCTAHTLY